MKKRMMGILLTLCVMLALLPGYATAAQSQDGLFTYEIETLGPYTYDPGANVAVITGCDQSASGVIQIPNELEGYPVRTVRSMGQCEKITELVLPSNLRTISADSLAGCTGLKTITVAENNSDLVSIDGVLYDKYDKDQLELVCCPQAKSGSISISSSAYRLGLFAFRGCRAITSINIPDSTNGGYYPYHVFGNNTLLEAIHVASGNARYASLDGVLYSKDMTTLYLVPQTKTGYTIPKTVARIEEYFTGNHLREIAVESGNTAFTSVDGVLFSIDKTKLIAYPGDKSKTYIVPDGVKEIDRAFNGNENLTQVTIPATVTSIDTDAFVGCSHLTDIFYQGTEANWNALSGTGKYILEIPTQTVVHFADSPVTPPPVPTEIPTPAPMNPFTDVRSGEYYYEPVLWAVNHTPQITNGTSATTFSPAATCTRGQVVTFLWRAAGQPEPASANNPFKDVKPTDYYYKAVLWAVEKGITLGTSASAFSPSDACTRAHVVTFLWRAENQPAAGKQNPFTDVKTGQYYTDAVLWAVEKGITLGTGASTFSPANPCTRGQIVTFLYRDMG